MLKKYLKRDQNKIKVVKNFKIYFQNEKMYQIKKNVFDIIKNYLFLKKSE